jgi:branched-subunit amino acid aminotransferase/4-amino-4-deoxychorismate lyase
MTKTDLGKGASQSHIMDGCDYADNKWAEGGRQIISPKDNATEFSYTNMVTAKGGEVCTSVINGIFLNDITKQRVIDHPKNAKVRIDGWVIPFVKLRESTEILISAISTIFRAPSLGIVACNPAHTKARSANCISPSPKLARSKP